MNFESIFGLIAVLATVFAIWCNEDWHRRCNKMNEEWFEHCMSMNKSWHATVDTLEKAKDEALSDMQKEIDALEERIKYLELIYYNYDDGR